MCASRVLSSRQLRGQHSTPVLPARPRVAGGVAVPASLRQIPCLHTGTAWDKGFLKAGLVGSLPSHGQGTCIRIGRGDLGGCPTPASPGGPFWCESGVQRPRCALHCAHMPAGPELVPASAQSSWSPKRRLAWEPRWEPRCWSMQDSSSRHPLHRPPCPCR